MSLGITEVWSGLDEAVSHTLSPRWPAGPRSSSLRADRVDALDALSQVPEDDDAAAERLCGVLYREVGRRPATSSSDR